MKLRTKLAVTQMNGKKRVHFYYEQQNDEIIADKPESTITTFTTEGSVADSELERD